MIEAIRLTKTYFDSDTRFHALNGSNAQVLDDSGIRNPVSV